MSIPSACRRHRPLVCTLALGAAAALLADGAAHAQTVVKRMNCGDGPVTLSTGVVFEGDRAYGPPLFAGYVGGTAVGVMGDHDGMFVGGYEDPHHLLHAWGREGFTSYLFDLPPGDYLLRLHCAELTLHGPQLRLFDVTVEGVPLLAELDLAARYGIQYGAVFAAPVTVADGQLSIVAGGQDPAILNALEIFTAPATHAAPAAVTGLTALGSYERNVLTWTPDSSPAVTGYRVYRAPTADGPFTLLAETWASPPRWLDSDVVPGQASHYRVGAVNATGLEGPAGATVSSTPLDSATSPLPVYSITIDPANLKILDEVILSDPKLTVPAVFSFEGQDWDVEVRYRGSSSRAWSKKSWKVKFPSSTPFQGQLDLNLKAHFTDASLLRDPMCTDLSHAIGHPAANYQPVHLRVNGVYRGVLSSVEEVEAEYLLARDRDPETSIYEVNHYLSLLPDLESYQFYYEKENGSGGHEDLIALIELINNTPDAEFPNALAAALDVDNLLSYYAMVGFVADGDSVRHNTFLMHDHSLGRWEVLTWDNEASWGGWAWGQNATLPIDFGTPGGSLPPWNVLKMRTLDVPAFRWRYGEKLRAIIDGAGALPAVQAAVAAGHAALAGNALADIAKYGWESGVLFEASPAIYDEFVPERKAFLLAKLATYQPAEPPTVVWINEFMADNGATLADEQGEFDDWIELYNASTAPADVGGLYLTDDLSQPTLWQIPGGTSIAPLGHLLVWADGETADGPLHAGFSLGAQGDEIGLFAADGVTLLDVYDFRPQLRDVSEGRAPDGGAFLRLMPDPTPGTVNSSAGNLPPWITWVQHSPAVVGATDSVTVSCQVTDADGVATVTLHARVDGGPFTATAMQDVGANLHEAVLGSQPAGALVEYYIAAQDGAGAGAAKPAGAPEDLLGFVVSAPQLSGVRVAEILADNVASLTDEAGEHEDWVELVNTTAAPIDISGLYLTDSFASPTKWAVPAGTILPAGASLLVWADDEPAEGPLHAGFKLSKSGEAVALFDSDGATLLDGYSFPAQLTDTGYGRMPDAADVLVFLLDASPGAANVPPDGEHRRFDLGNQGANGVALAGAAAAQVGGSLTWSVTGAPPSAGGVLVLGIETVIAPTPAKGTLLVAPLVLLPFTADPAGAAILAVPVPSDPVLAHLVVYAQPFVAGAGLGSALASRLAD